MTSPEQSILQWRDTADYLKSKIGSQLTLKNEMEVRRQLYFLGWQQVGQEWVKGDTRLDLIRAGERAFRDEYERRRREWLRVTVEEFRESP